MFKDTLGSPRFFAEEAEESTSILSPRNFLKFITNSIDQVRKAALNTPNRVNYQQFVATFDPYLSLFEQQYKKYKKNRCKVAESNQKNQQLQIELKINKIPPKYFLQPNSFVLEMFRRNELRSKQQQLTQFLDQIEVVLFAKSGKYPQKSVIILNNMAQLQLKVNSSLEKVVFFRKSIKSNLVKSSEKQLKIKRIQQRIRNIQKIRQNIFLMKKMRDLKIISKRQNQKKDYINQQILLQVKKSELQVCNRFFSMKKQLNNIEKYRSSVKEKLYKEFVDQIQVIFNKLLKYNKDDWKNINIPQSIFTNQANENNISHNNITILDQSYFAFDANPIHLTNKNIQAQQNYQISEENEDDDDVLNLNKVYDLWNILKQFDLYDESELNESLLRVLVKHNAKFNQDMHDYVNFLNQLCKRDKSNLLKNGAQTYANLKAKQASMKEQEPQNQSNQQKLSTLDMKLFIKVAKFYFNLLKKVILLINSNKELTFLVNFKGKLCQFLQSRINYFIDLKEMTQELKIEDFFLFLQIIVFWQSEQFYEIDQFCQNMRKSKIDQYLTSIHKNLLIKQIKQSIQISNYSPVNISSDHYMTFHNLLSSNRDGQEEVNMSMTILQQAQRGQENRGEVVLRLINKNIFYKDKIYKFCDSFLEFVKHIQKYVKLKQALSDFQQNIEEKICETVGFYAWYNQKNLTNNKNGSKTLKNYCTFYSTLLFLKQILPQLLIVNKKIDKTKAQLNECDTQISKTITMTPFIMIQQKISQLYQSRISTRPQVPTTQTQRIIDIVKISMDCLKEYFPIQFEQRINESFIFKFLQTTIKLLFKNYFGYLVNMQKRGIAQIRWFLPKLKEILQVTIISNNKIMDKKGELICKNGSNTFYIFNEEIQQMQKVLKAKFK